MVYHAHGGFVIGSNTDGGMRNIFVTDCSFIGTDVGIRVKSNAGRGGLVKDIFVQDISMSNIVNEAVLFDTYYEDVPTGTVKDASRPTPADKVPEFRDFHISRIYCNGAKTAIAITGLPQMPVNKIYFEDIIISAGKGLVATEASNINLKNVKLITSKDPVYVLNNATNISINGGYFSPGNKVFVQAEGKTSGVKITATNLRKSADAILLGANVDKQAVVTE